MNLRALIIAGLTLLITACSSNPTKLNIMHMNALGSEDFNDGRFNGLEHLANSLEDQPFERVNIFYLHGIGFTEDPEDEALASTFLTGIAEAYNLTLSESTLNSRCARDSEAEETVGNSIDITTGDTPVIYHTIIPGVTLKLEKLVCMDRQTLRVSPKLEYVVYRIFWDEIFWDSIQEAHVGQDDDAGYSRGIASLRRKYNRRLKDEMVNYGFSDAVMYLGPAGQEIRYAIKGAMCSAALDAAGFDFEKQGRAVSAAHACELASNTNTISNQFAFVSESLGSKITFDLMRDSLTDGKDTIMDDMIAGSEIYMLANQLPLLSLSNLSQDESLPAQNNKNRPRPKIIALSEINDFLSYEISPFFKNLWSRQVMAEGRPVPPFDSRAREQLSAALGFDFVDIRLEFADPIVGLIKDFVDPLQAHSKHVAEPEIIQLMLCGAENGLVTRANCQVRADTEKKR